MNCKFYSTKSVPKSTRSLQASARKLDPKYAQAMKFVTSYKRLSNAFSKERELMAVTYRSDIKRKSSKMKAFLPYSQSMNLQTDD